MKDSVILLTGGTGSLGYDLVTTALKHDVKAIRIYSRNEYLQWQMKRVFTDPRLHWMIGDVRDREQLSSCMRGVDYVIHAAALKHVSTGQNDPQEVIKTNVLGTINVIDVAVASGVKKVLGFSSDKAVSPSCLYGLTKQVMEMLFLEANNRHNTATTFSIFRSGNFFESRGNVFELWEKQAANGEVTLTSTDMYRYFIPVKEVAELTVRLLKTMQGGEIFVPKMKEYSMLDLCKQRYPQCRIKITGKSPGEKEREALFVDGEVITEHNDYFSVKI